MVLLGRYSVLIAAERAMAAEVQTALIAASIIVVIAALAFAGYVLIRNNNKEQYEDQASPGDTVDIAKEDLSPARKPDVLRPAVEAAEGKTPAPVTEKAVIPLKISDVRIEPLMARPGQMVDIQFSATNLDSAQIGHEVILKINGQIFNVRQISILPNSIMHLSFKVMLTEPGSYTVDINGTTGIFTVIQ
jgi:hypothetical protein